MIWVVDFVMTIHSNLIYTRSFYLLQSEFMGSTFNFHTDTDLCTGQTGGPPALRLPCVQDQATRSHLHSDWLGGSPPDLEKIGSGAWLHSVWLSQCFHTNFQAPPTFGLSHWRPRASRPSGFSLELGFFFKYKKPTVWSIDGTKTCVHTAVYTVYASLFKLCLICRIKI